jgi:hypothetical protein
MKLWKRIAQGQPPKPVDVTGIGFILWTGNQFSFSMILSIPFFRRSVDVAA